MVGLQTVTQPEADDCVTQTQPAYLDDQPI